jgi:processive 1,2-diacylglycerol beta-glucosyltransferase
MLAPPLLGRAMQRGALPSIPQWIQITDIYPHRWWYAEHIDRWFLPQDATADRLEQWGIEADRRIVSGIPIMPKWNRPLPDDAELRRQLRLPVDGPIILLSGGAEFTCGPVVKMTRRLAEAVPEACVVALAGRNKSLLAKFGALAGRYPGRVVPMGFTDRMHELSHVASLLVTKPGGIITSEAQAKGTPMLFVRPVPGQEAHNAAFLVERGAGVVARRSGEAVEMAKTLLADPGRLAAMAAAAVSLYRPARETVVEAISRQLLGEHPSPAVP